MDENTARDIHRQRRQAKSGKNEGFVTHHHVVGFWDVDFKLESSTLVVALIWRVET